jgi:hypothetical protein
MGTEEILTGTIPTLVAGAVVIKTADALGFTKQTRHKKGKQKKGLLL